MDLQPFLYSRVLCGARDFCSPCTVSLISQQIQLRQVSIHMCATSPHPANLFQLLWVLSQVCAVICWQAPIYPASQPHHQGWDWCQINVGINWPCIFQFVHMGYSLSSLSPISFHLSFLIACLADFGSQTGGKILIQTTLITIRPNSY